MSKMTEDQVLCHCCEKPLPQMSVEIIRQYIDSSGKPLDCGMNMSAVFRFCPDCFSLMNRVLYLQDKVDLNELFNSIIRGESISITPPAMPPKKITKDQMDEWDKGKRACHPKHVGKYFLEDSDD